MALRSKVQNRPRLVFLQQRPHQRAVADIALHKHMSRIAFNRHQIPAIARVRQQVQIHNPGLRLRNPIEHEVGADKPRATRHQYRIVHAAPILRILVQFPRQAWSKLLRRPVYLSYVNASPGWDGPIGAGVPKTEQDRESGYRCEGVNCPSVYPSPASETYSPVASV
jgi:hypothetical protein